MKNTQTIEEIVSQVALDEPLKLSIGDREIEVPRPTLGTIIRVSAAISTLPHVENVTDGISGREVAIRALSVADRAMPVAEILAIAMLGDGNTEKVETREVYVPMPGILGKIGLKRKVVQEWHVDRVKPLADQLAAKLTLPKMVQAIIDILNQSELGSFFELIAFLQEVNVLRKATTTASGQSSQECAKPSD